MNGREAKQINTGFWKLVMDPNVSNEHFLKIHREFMARREALERAQGRSISRREFVALSAGISTAFGLASLVGSATLSRPAQAQPTAKGVKKGLMRIGYINTLDCCLLDYVLEKKGILQSMGWDVKVHRPALGSAGDGSLHRQRGRLRLRRLEYAGHGGAARHLRQAPRRRHDGHGRVERRNGLAQGVGLAARPGLPVEMLQACVEAHKRACEWMANNVEESIKIAADIAGTTGPVEYVAMFNRSRWHYGLNWDSIDSVWNNTMRKIGLAKKNLKLDDLVDTQNSVQLKPPSTPRALILQCGKT